MLEFVTLRSEFCDTYFCVCDTHFRDLGGAKTQNHGFYVVFASIEKLQKHEFDFWKFKKDQKT